VEWKPLLHDNLALMRNSSSAGQEPVPDSLDLRRSHRIPRGSDPHLLSHCPRAGEYKFFIRVLLIHSWPYSVVTLVDYFEVLEFSLRSH